MDVVEDFPTARGPRKGKAIGSEKKFSDTCDSEANPKSQVQEGSEKKQIGGNAAGFFRRRNYPR